jgi:hypothetical protein
MRSNPKTPNTYKGILWNALKLPTGMVLFFLLWVYRPI